MNSSDVAQMDLKPFDVLDFDAYQDGGSGSGKSYAPPAEGRYTGRVPQILDDGTDVISTTNAFGRTQEGYLKLQLDTIDILDPAANGYQVRFTRLSSKKYAKRNGSQVMDFLRACGIEARPTSEAELRAVIKQAAGRPFTFQLNWEGYNKDTQENIPSEAFATDASGKRATYIVDEFDSSKKWFANGKVRYFVSALGAKQ